MEGAFSQHEHGQVGSDASSLQRHESGSDYLPRTGARAGPPDRQHPSDRSPDGFWSFLAGVVKDEDSTRRLGYLIKQIGIATSTILIALAAAMYIAIYKSPVQVKIFVSFGSFLLITAGSVLVRLRRPRGAKPGGAARGSPRAGHATKPVKAQPPSSDGDGGIGQANGTDREHTSHESPQDDLGGASHPR